MQKVSYGIRAISIYYIERILQNRFTRFIIREDIQKEQGICQKISSQNLHKKISTLLLTLLIISVIVQLEQRKGEQKEQGTKK